MSTDLQATSLQPVSRRTKRKHPSDDVEAVKGSRRASRSSYTNSRPLKRRKTKKPGSASAKEFLILSKEPDSDCDTRNNSRTPQQDVFRSSPTLCPSDAHSHLYRISDSNNKCPTSPVHSPPSPLSRMLQRQQVDWTYVSDTEDTVVSRRTAGSGDKGIPTGRDSGDRVVGDDSDDTGYVGASEWEAMSDASLQGRFSMKDVVLIHSDDGRTIFTRQHAAPCLDDGGGRVIGEDYRSAPSSRTELVLRSYTPSPMNSDDYRRMNDAVYDREPSPLSSRTVGNAEHEHSEPPHVIVCYPFCDSPEPLSEGFGYPCRVMPNHEVKEAGEPQLDDVTQDRDVSYGSLEQNIDSRHQGIRRGAAAFKNQPSPSRTYVACSAYTQATYYERGRLWPVFDWSCPYPVDQDSSFPGDDPDEPGSKKVATTQVDFLYGDKELVDKWAREIVAVGTENIRLK